MPGVAEANTVHGPGAAATGSGSTAVGDNTKAKGNNAVAVGPLTNADGENSLAAGYDAKTGSTAENSVAIGRGARALGQKRAGDQFTASTIAIGNVATAAENGDIVIGRQAKSTVPSIILIPKVVTARLSWERRPLLMVPGAMW